MNFSDGGKYEGQWANGKEHGVGIRMWAVKSGRTVGSRYEGEWCEGKRHGQGTHTAADGTMYVFSV
jgi:hypothetical protein